MEKGSVGSRNSSTRHDVLEKVGLAKPKQHEVCGEIDGADGYSQESLRSPPYITLHNSGGTTHM